MAESNPSTPTITSTSSECGSFERAHADERAARSMAAAEEAAWAKTCEDSGLRGNALERALEYRQAVWARIVSPNGIKRFGAVTVDGAGDGVLDTVRYPLMARIAAKTARGKPEDLRLPLMEWPVAVSLYRGDDLVFTTSVRQLADGELRADQQQ